MISKYENEKVDRVFLFYKTKAFTYYTDKILETIEPIPAWNTVDDLNRVRTRSNLLGIAAGETGLILYKIEKQKEVKLV